MLKFRENAKNANIRQFTYLLTYYFLVCFLCKMVKILNILSKLKMLRMLRMLENVDILVKWWHFQKMLTILENAETFTK